MLKKHKFLAGIHIFVSIGALFGGMAAILNPWEPLGTPLEMLENSPFENFFIPGLILFLVIGIGHLFSAVTALKHSIYLGYISSIFSWSLVIWIVVQCVMINSVNFMHIFFLVIGLSGAILAFQVMSEMEQFPATLFKKRES